MGWCQAPPCNCWVRRMSAEDQFGIRYGAHNPECPVFKPTLDPVKAVADAELRMEQETGITVSGRMADDWNERRSLP